MNKWGLRYNLPILVFERDWCIPRTPSGQFSLLVQGAKWVSLCLFLNEVHSCVFAAIFSSVHPQYAQLFTPFVQVISLFPPHTHTFFIRWSAQKLTQVVTDGKMKILSTLRAQTVCGIDASRRCCHARTYTYIGNDNALPCPSSSLPTSRHETYICHNTTRKRIPSTYTFHTRMNVLAYSMVYMMGNTRRSAYIRCDDALQTRAICHAMSTRTTTGPTPHQHRSSFLGCRHVARIITMHIKQQKGNMVW